jgi:hypothetical protein
MKSKPGNWHWCHPQSLFWIHQFVGSENIMEGVNLFKIPCTHVWIITVKSPGISNVWSFKNTIKHFKMNSTVLHTFVCACVDVCICVWIIYVAFKKVNNTAYNLLNLFSSFWKHF